MISTLLSWFRPSKQQTNFDHKINADISIIPLGTPEGASTSRYVKEAGRILAQSGFREVHPHAFGTNISGNWSNLKTAIEEIAKHQLDELGIPRLAIDLKLSFRRDKDESIGARLAKA